jgi:Na+-translocating ferredoxin:NAD+ oxidoreductase RnfG subunit
MRNFRTAYLLLAVSMLLTACNNKPAEPAIDNAADAMTTEATDNAMTTETTDNAVAAAATDNTMTADVNNSGVPELSSSGAGPTK